LLWHYQTVVLREFLPSLIGAELTDLIAQGERRYYRPRDQPFIYYILREADVRRGNRLGPVGSRIVGDLLMGLGRVPPNRASSPLQSLHR
jgi:hypothetical protein